ncbi:MAG: hypothetical protein AB1753_06920 [Thermoproteota archaeon]
MSAHDDEREESRIQPEEGETEGRGPGQEIADKGEEPQEQTMPSPQPEKPAAPANPDDQAEQLLAPYSSKLVRGGSAAPKIREVLTALHEADSALLNSDLYPRIKKKIVSALGVSPALVDKSKKEVLEIKDKDNSDEPIFPQAPRGGSKQQAATTIATTGGAPISGGAPFAAGGAATTIAAASPEGNTDQEAPEEPMVWDARKVGVITSTMLNVPSWFLEEWVRVTKEERDELGKLFLDTFKEMFPTSKKAGQLIFTLAALEAVLKPRIMAVMEYRLKKKQLEEVRQNASKEIEEAHNDGKE